MTVGEVLRNLRNKRRASLETVANALGVSTSYLSRVERGITDPTFGQLRKLCEIYHTTIQEITGIVEEGRPVNNYGIVRAGNGIKLESGNVKLELLSGPETHNVEAMVAYHEPGSHSGKLYSHSGEEFNYILEGSIHYLVGDEELELSKGDSICHPSEIPHGWRNDGEHAAVVLTVVSPPSFLF